MARYRILLTDYAWSNLDIERETLATEDAELVLPADAGEDALAAAAAGVDGIMTTWARVTRRVINAAPDCRIVSRLGIGLDNIDVEHATSRGILVTNVPDYCQIEVAEHTLALILALGRKVAHYHLETKRGRYDLASGPRLARLEGQIVGIVGLGRIGLTVARKALALGFRVIANTRTARSTEPEIQLTDLPNLLAASDYVTLHVPSNRQTRHLIGRQELASMKRTAYLINTSRGALVDHDALAAALGANLLAGAALDVQDPEPPDLSRPPFNDPRVIVTPHAAFSSEQCVAELRRRASRQMCDVLAGRTPPNIVNRVD